MGERPKKRPTAPWEDACACGAVYDMRNGSGLCKRCSSEELSPDQIARNLGASRPQRREKPVPRR
jgi:hypothetical protein